MHDLNVVEIAASAHNYATMYMNIPATSSGHQKLLRFIERREVGGMIITGDLDDTLIRLIQGAKMPYLFYGATTKDDANIVVLDHRKAAYEAVKHLITLGHRRIAFFSGRMDASVHVQNLNGYYQAFQEADIPIDKSMIQISIEEDGYELAARVRALDIAFTAAFCVNTVIQFGALQWFNENGISVPSQCSLIGYGYSELVRLSKPELTTVYVDQEEKKKIVTELLDIMKKGRTAAPRLTYLSETALHIGGTTTICLTP
jgi:DNA-binding LacI/PurR family transcriptional regulator